MKNADDKNIFFQEIGCLLLSAIETDKPHETFLTALVGYDDFIFAALGPFYKIASPIMDKIQWDPFPLSPTEIAKKLAQEFSAVILPSTNPSVKNKPSLVVVLHSGSGLYEKKYRQQWTVLQNSVGYFSKITAMTDIESEKRFQALVETASDLIAIYVDDIIRYVNPAAVRMMGFNSADEIIGESPYKFIHPDSLPVIEQRRAFFSQGRQGPLPTVEEKLITASGEVKEIEVVTNLIEYFGKPAIMAIGRDVTQRKRAEEALLESERRYRALVERSPNAIIVIDPERRITYLNPAGIQLLGGALSEAIINQKITVFLNRIDPDVGFNLALREMVETTLSRQDGKIIDVEFSAAEIFSKGQSALQLIIRNISARKQAERDLIESREEMRSLFRYAQNVAEIERTHISREIHDQLGQFLTGLKMDIAFLQRHLKDSQADLQKKTANMIMVIDSTIRMVRRISAKLRPEILDNFGLAAAIEWQSRDYQERSGICCRFAAQPPELNLSKELNTVFFRIYQELMTNIIRHAGAKNISIYLYKTDHEAILDVEDDGIGIDLNQINRHDSLGIIGMRERAKYMNGDIVFERNKNRGTRVRVCIPYEYGEDK